MLYPEFDEKLSDAKQALNEATSDNVNELCVEYLALLFEYRRVLYKLQGTSVINLQPGSSSEEEVENIRKEVRGAIENITQERNRTSALLRSLTVVSGYEAAETFNRLKYEGHDNWEARAGGVGLSEETNSNRLTIQEAVDMARLLRRDEYVVKISPNIYKRNGFRSLTLHL